MMFLGKVIFLGCKWDTLVTYIDFRKMIMHWLIISGIWGTLVSDVQEPQVRGVLFLLYLGWSNAGTVVHCFPEPYPRLICYKWHKNLTVPRRTTHKSGKSERSSGSRDTMQWPSVLIRGNEPKWTLEFKPQKPPFSLSSKWQPYICK